MLGMASENNDDNVPEEIEDTCIDCHHSLASVDRLLKPLLATTRADLEQNVSVFHHEARGEVEDVTDYRCYS